MLLYSDVANVIKDNEEIDAFEVVVDDKQTAPESTQEVVNDNLDKEKDVRGRHLSRPRRPFWGPWRRFSFLRTALTPFRMPDLNSSGMLKDQFSGRRNHFKCNSNTIVLLNIFS